jgi:hypothetical protein
VVGQKLPQSSPCLICEANVTLPKLVPRGWWLALKNNWVNPPTLVASTDTGSCREPQSEYLVKVKANGYTLKSILPYVCSECQERLKSEARQAWACEVE